MAPIYIPQALNTGTCIDSIIWKDEQGELFYSAGPPGTGVSHSQQRKNSGEVLAKMQVNGPGG